MAYFGRQECDGYPSRRLGKLSLKTRLRLLRAQGANDTGGNGHRSDEECSKAPEQGIETKRHKKRVTRHQRHTGRNKADKRSYADDSDNHVRPFHRKPDSARRHSEVPETVLFRSAVTMAVIYDQIWTREVNFR